MIVGMLEFLSTSNKKVTSLPKRQSHWHIHVATHWFTLHQCCAIILASATASTFWRSTGPRLSPIFNNHSIYLRFLSDNQVGEPNTTLWKAGKQNSSDKLRMDMCMLSQSIQSGGCWPKLPSNGWLVFVWGLLCSHLLSPDRPGLFICLVNWCEIVQAYFSS